MTNALSNGGPSASHSIPAIKSQDLFDIFQAVLEKWAFLPCDFMGDTVEGPANLPLERMVGFSGPLEGCLVVRSSAGFGKHLWENVSGDDESEGDTPHGDAFSEFVNLYFGHLLALFRQSVEGTFDPFLPQSSIPSLWPDRRPDAALALLVENIPVEVRLWIDRPSASTAARVPDHE